MAIQSGTHLGPYEIISAIGAGGIGAEPSEYLHDLQDSGIIECPRTGFTFGAGSALVR
jgi:hypothetical protein